MCEVNARNFKSLYPTITNHLEKAKFISIDLEYSALNPLERCNPSIFDTPKERYKKMRLNLEHVAPLQVGLTAFTFNPKENIYTGRIYTFYVQPASFQHLDRNIVFQTSTLNFLMAYNFDFNKFAYDGIPFINKNQELKLRKKIQNDELFENDTSSPFLIADIIYKQDTVIKSWYEQAKPGDSLEVPQVFSGNRDNYEMLFFLQKIFRNRFPYVWTKAEHQRFVITKVTSEERLLLEAKENLESELIDNLIGFSKIIRFIIDLKKPIVGHNCFVDLLLILHNFESCLPVSYNHFKTSIIQLFPIIFDTKTLAYSLRKSIPRDTEWCDKGLGDIFDYFKNSKGPHNSPVVELDYSEYIYGKIHDAGWDSFCTGYIFVKFAHLNIYSKYPPSKTFVTNEYIGGLMPFMNLVNVIRCSTASIKLDGPDPISTRPPYLVIESRKNKPVSIPQICSLLSAFGLVEIRRIKFSKTKVLIAPGSYSNARRIVDELKTNPEFSVSKYNWVKHSLAARILIITGFSFSSGVFLWLAVNAFTNK